MCIYYGTKRVNFVGAVLILLLHCNRLCVLKFSRVHADITIVIH